MSEPTVDDIIEKANSYAVSIACFGAAWIFKIRWRIDLLSDFLRVGGRARRERGTAVMGAAEEMGVSLRGEKTPLAAVRFAARAIGTLGRGDAPAALV